MALPVAWWVAADCSWCTRVRAAPVVPLRDRIAIVGAAIGAVGGHLRRGLGLAVVVVVGVTGGGVSYHLVGLSDPEDIKLLDDVDKMIAAHKERSGGAAADVGSAAAAADEPGGGVQAKKRRK